ncbi:hypothetical protein Hanom_Chr16g01433411 [Helianthus anomalus]
MFLLTLTLAAGAGAGVSRNPMWFVYDGVSCVAGFMSGLTLGLMSLGLVELEILHQSGSNREKKQAGSCFCNYVIESENLIHEVEDCVVEVRENEPSVTKSVVFGGNGGGVVAGILYKWMMWEDGFCRGRMMDCVEDMDAGEDLVRRKKEREKKKERGVGWVGGQND